MNKTFSLIIIGLLFISFTFTSISGNTGVTGTYRPIESDSYEIVIYLPYSHFSYYIERIDRSFNNSMSTNVVIFTVNQQELNLLQNSFIIIADGSTEYDVTLSKLIPPERTLSSIEYLVVFLIGLIVLLFISFVMVRELRRPAKELTGEQYQ